VLLTLTIGSPADGFVTTDPNVVFAGTTTGTRVNITSIYLGTPDSTPAPSPSPSPAPSPAPTGTGPSPTPAPIGPARDVTVSATGVFNETLTFTPGRWQLTIVSFATGQTPVARQITIVVDEPGPITHHLQLTIENHAASVKVVADGSRVANETLNPGDAREFTATNEFCVKTDNAGSLHFVLDGLALGPLGADSESGSWIIKPGIAPVRAPRPC
jgi:hypothetical protein